MALYRCPSCEQPYIVGVGRAITEQEYHLQQENKRLRRALDKIAHENPQFDGPTDVQANFHQRVAEWSMMWALIGLGVQKPEAYGLPADVLEG